MDRNADTFLERLYQFICCVRLEEARHILDGQNMRAHFLQLFCHTDIVLKRVFVTFRVCDIAGIADSRFADFPRFAHCIHRHLHTGCPVERVENAEDIDAGVSSLFDKFLHDIVGIIGIAHRV